ncbi:MAG: gamma carbonic anhydrase family protein [Methanospirillaceae archaeon]|nr:gamma carbonic anhydrase family protein [Methanospirillaceae archaeon]
MNYHQSPVPDSVFIAPNATLTGDITLGSSANIWFGAVVRADKAAVTIGDGSNIQDTCVVHTSRSFPVIIGRNVSVGHGAILHGCTVEDNVLVGMGAIILNGAVIREGSIIGAGALVSEGKNIPSRSLVLGLPGKVVRDVSEDEYRGIIHNAEEYVKLAGKYRNE